MTTTDRTATIESATRTPTYEIAHYVEIRATPAEVYEALTTAEGVRKWWTRDTALEPKLGAEGRFGFNDGNFIITAKVNELKPNERVHWSDVTSTHGIFDGTTITFDISPGENATGLAFAHRGFKNPAGIAPPNTRWAYYLFSLKDHLESGKGTPHPDDMYL
jgi:uncharacterized protein YndB with AHSA1/START domain